MEAIENGITYHDYVIAYYSKPEFSTGNHVGTMLRIRRLRADGSLYLRDTDLSNNLSLTLELSENYASGTFSGSSATTTITQGEFKNLMLTP